MKRIFRTVCAVLSAVLTLGAACAEQLPLLEANSMKDHFISNPRSIKDIGDPFVLTADGSYYTFATGGAIGFKVWQSVDLAKFDQSKAMTKTSWASGDYWAPEVFQWQGQYVMIYTARRKTDKSLRIGIAVSDTPEGPYTDPLEQPLFDFGYAAIDGTLVVDDDGIPYLIYSRDCSENVVNERHESHLYGVQLAADLMSVCGEPVLLTQPDQAWEMTSGDYRWNEGPAVVKHDGKYYLFYSANYYADRAYSIGVAVSDAPLGPYVKQSNNPILTCVEADGQTVVSGPGHNAFFQVGDELFTSYHTHTYPKNPTGNRQLCIDRAGFHADGTAFINGPTLSAQLKPLQDLNAVNLLQRAVPSDEQAALLTDGDTCQAASSSAYAWKETQAAFTWEQPGAAYMLLIYAPRDAAASGTVLLNNSLETAFTLNADRGIGEPCVLVFEQMTVESLRIECDAALGEIMLIGPKE